MPLMEKTINSKNKIMEENYKLINSPSNLKLLTEHTYKYFVNKKNQLPKEAQLSTKKLLTHYNNNLWGVNGLAQFIGSQSFTFFNFYYLQDLLINGDDKAPLSETHFKIWEELENTILIKDYSQRNYILPRGTGKTTTLSIPLVIWCHVYKYKDYSVLASAVSSTAQQFLASIKTNIKDNIYLTYTFGELIDTKIYTVNSEKIQLTNRTAIESLSASGAIRGKQNELSNKRIELLICDDYQTSEQTKTEDQRNSKWTTFNSDAKNAMQKDNSTIITFGTVQHRDDFYSRLLKSPTWKSRLEKGVLLDDIESYFDSGHWLEFKKLLSNAKDENRLDTAKEYYIQNYDEMQFPMLWDYWQCLDFALNYYEDKQSFMREIQNDTTLFGERRFKTIITKSSAEIESVNFTKTILAIDPAGTRNTGKKKDYYAFAIGSISDNGLKYIRKGLIYQFEFEDYMDTTLKLLKDYPDITHVAIEKQTYSGADVLRLLDLIKEDPLLRSRKLEWINKHQSKNKDAKINSIVGAVNLGQIIFNEEDMEAIVQLSEFTSANLSTHDDFPDVVAELAGLLDEVDIYKPIKVTDNWFN